jgi:hypothetical protein
MTYEARLWILAGIAAVLFLWYVARPIGIALLVFWRARRKD